MSKSEPQPLFFIVTEHGECVSEEFWFLGTPKELGELPLREDLGRAPSGILLSPLPGFKL